MRIAIWVAASMLNLVILAIARGLALALPVVMASLDVIDRCHWCERANLFYIGGYRCSDHKHVRLPTVLGVWAPLLFVLAGPVGTIGAAAVYVMQRITEHTLRRAIERRQLAADVAELEADLRVSDPSTP